ncbi:HEPN domain-containing protein [Shewanella baltica]|uniref:HEPN domain-containing protein n=1 Tax=Shewanella baltica TaxID=62322 RepID=UPI0039AFBC2B
MGSMSELHLDIQEQQMRDWICEQMGSDEVDEFSDEWNALATEWCNQQEYYQDYSYYESLELSELNHNFMFEMEKLYEIVNAKIPCHLENVTFKMVHAYAVTILESFLTHAFISLVSKDDRLLNNLIRAYSNCKDPKTYTLQEIAHFDGSVKNLVLGKISQTLFHDSKRIECTYRDTFNTALKYDFKELNKIFTIRHDIVHRSGRDKSGFDSTPNRESIEKTLATIKRFITAFEDKVRSQLS